MKVSLWILLLGLLALVQGRDYCYGGRMCSQDMECEQNDGYGGVDGWCCNGRCTNTDPILARGAFCNNSDPCVGSCSGADSCINNVCTGYGVTESCTCTQAGSQQCNSVQIGTSIQGTCTLDTSTCTLALPRDAACSMNSSCASNNGCYMGTCLGKNLKIGSSCRLSEECGNYQCLNGKCAYRSVGMPCVTSSACDSTKNWCNTTLPPYLCQQLLTAGMNCTASSQCVSTTYCAYVSGVGYTNCTARQSEGQDCSIIPCGANLYCTNYNYGVYKCVRYSSVASYGYCTTSSVCMSSHTCARYGENNTANFCVPNYSQPAGANCSSTATCPEYGKCNTTTFPYTCTESYLNKACDANSTNADSFYCGSNTNLECGCDNKCYAPDIAYTSCASGAALAPGDPTKMNSEDATATAKYLCCYYCGYGAQLTTALTGFDVNCDTFKFRLKPVCNITSGGSLALIGCGGCFTATTNFALLGALLFSLVAYFY